VKDMGLAEFGRKELTLAEIEMPGLMAARKEFGPAQPFKGLDINGSLHMTIQTGVLIETLLPWAPRCGGAPATFLAPRIMQQLPLRRLAPPLSLHGRARLSRSTGGALSR